MRNLLSFENVPHVTREVVVPPKEQPPALGEVYRRYPAQNVVVGVLHELLSDSEVKQPAGRIVAASPERVPVGEETHVVDVGLVPLKGALAVPAPNVPQLGGGVAPSAYERLDVLRRDVDAHDVPVVVRELGLLLPGLDVPQNTRHVSARC